jgi:hypothetical protein
MLPKAVLQTTDKREVSKAPKTYDGEQTAFLTNVAGKSVYLPAEN